MNKWVKLLIAAVVVFAVAFVLAACATPEQMEQMEQRERQETRIERIISENVACIELDMNYTICDVRMPNSGVDCVALIEWDSAELSCDWVGY